MDFSAFEKRKTKGSAKKLDFSAFEKSKTKNNKSSEEELDKRYQENVNKQNRESLKKLGLSEDLADKIGGSTPLKTINLPGGYQAKAESYYGKDQIKSKKPTFSQKDYESMAQKDNVKRKNLFGVLKTEVDHLAPNALGGTNEPQNLKTVKAKTGFLGLFKPKTPSNEMPDANRQGGTLEMEKKIIDAYQNGQLTQPQSLLLIKQLKDVRDNQPKENFLTKLAKTVASKIAKPKQIEQPKIQEPQIILKEKTLSGMANEWKDISSNIKNKEYNQFQQEALNPKGYQIGLGETVLRSVAAELIPGILRAGLGTLKAGLETTKYPEPIAGISSSIPGVGFNNPIFRMPIIKDIVSKGVDMVMPEIDKAVGGIEKYQTETLSPIYERPENYDLATNSQKVKQYTNQLLSQNISGLISLGEMIGISYATKNPTLTLGVMADMTGSDMYLSARQKGVKPLQAMGLGVAMGTITALSEKITLGIISGKGLGGIQIKGLIKRYIIGYLSETTQEVGEQIGQNLLTMTFDKDAKVTDSLIETTTGMILPSLLTSGLGGANRSILVNRIIKEAKRQGVNASKDDVNKILDDSSKLLEDKTINLFDEVITKIRNQSKVEQVSSIYDDLANNKFNIPVDENIKQEFANSEAIQNIINTSKNEREANAKLVQRFMDLNALTEQDLEVANQKQTEAIKKFIEDKGTKLREETEQDNKLDPKNFDNVDDYIKANNETTYRGASIAEWESVQQTGIFEKPSGSRLINKQTGEEIRTKDDEAINTSPEKRLAELYANGSSKEGVVIEFKPEAKRKMKFSAKFDSTDLKADEYLSEGLTLDDVFRVTNKNGKVIYESTTNGKTKSQLIEEWNKANQSVDTKKTKYRMPWTIRKVKSRAESSIGLSPTERNIQMSIDKQLDVLRRENNKKKPNKNVIRNANKVYNDLLNQKYAARKKAIRDYINNRYPRFRLSESMLDSTIIDNGINLTTKFLEFSDIKNRKTANYRFLYDLSKSDKLQLKQVERELIQNTLDRYFKDSKEIDMDEFRKIIVSQLLPLEIKSTTDSGENFETYGSDMIGADNGMWEHTTYVFNSPINHGVLVDKHFSNMYKEIIVDEKDVEVKAVKEKPGSLIQRFAVVRKSTEKQTKKKTPKYTLEKVDESYWSVFDENRNVIESVRATNRAIALAKLSYESEVGLEETQTKYVKKSKGILFIGNTEEEAKQWIFQHTYNPDNTLFYEADNESVKELTDKKDLSVGLVVGIGRNGELNFNTRNSYVVTEVLPDGKFFVVPRPNIDVAIEDSGRMASYKEFIEFTNEETIRRMKPMVYYLQGKTPKLLDLQTKGLFGSVRIFLHKATGIAIFAENQSDAFQGESISRRLHKEFDDLYQKIERVRMDRDERRTDDEKTAEIARLKEEGNYYKLKAEADELFKKTYPILYQYNDIWHERMIRETISMLANQGVKEIWFPTERTMAIIEKYIGNNEEDFDNETMPYTIENADNQEVLKPGDTIDYGGETYVVLDADNNTISVAPQNRVNIFKIDEVIDDFVQNRWGDVDYEWIKFQDLFGEVKNKKDIQKAIDNIETYNELINYYQKYDKINRLKSSAKETIDRYNNKRELENIKTMKKFIDDLDNGTIENKYKFNTAEEFFQTSISDQILNDYDLSAFRLYNNKNLIGTEIREDLLVSLRNNALDDIKINENTIQENKDRIKNVKEITKREVDKLEAIEKPSQEKIDKLNEKALEDSKKYSYNYEIDYNIQEILDEIELQDTETKPHWKLIMNNKDITVATKKEDVEQAMKNLKESRVSSERDDRYQIVRVEGTDSDFNIDDFYQEYEEKFIQQEKESLDINEIMIGTLYTHGDTVYELDEGAGTETFFHPNLYKEKEKISDLDNFDISSFKGYERTVLEYYKKSIKYQSKIRQNNFEKINTNDVDTISLDNNLEFYKSVFSENDKGKPAAFRVKEDLERDGFPMSEKMYKFLLKESKRIFGDYNIKVLGQIIENKEALGMYRDTWISILKKQAKPKDTFYHEAEHKYFDVFLTEDEQIELLTLAMEKYGTNNIALADEKMAEGILEYTKTGEGFVGRMKVLIDRVLLRIKKYFGNEDKITQFYNDILSGKARKMVELREKAMSPPIKTPILVDTPDDKKKPKEVISTPKKRDIAEDKPVQFTKGEVRESSVYKKWKDKLGIELPDSTTYDVANLAEQTARAELFVNENWDLAVRIAKGLEMAPEGILNEKISTAVIRRAINMNNNELANSIVRKLSLKSTRMGQEISALQGEFTEDDTYTLVNQLLRDKRNKLLNITYKKDGSSNTEKSFEERITQKAKVDNKIINKKAASIQSAQDILDSLIC
jgi:hypothetical protein